MPRHSCGLRPLEDALAALPGAGVAPAKIDAIAVSGQQHGSVYLTREGVDFAQLNVSLATALPRNSRKRWQERWHRSGPTAPRARQCNEIRATLGGTERSVDLTGSDVCERFTAAQIRKFSSTRASRLGAHRWHRSRLELRHFGVVGIMGPDRSGRRRRHQSGRHPRAQLEP